jgi:antitoxin VapB
MRTVSIFMNSRNQAIRIPRDMEYQGVSELEIIRDGETLILRPVRLLASLRDVAAADPDFLTERKGCDRGRPFPVTSHEQKDVHARYEHLFVHHARRPDAVLAKLEQAVTNQHRIVVSPLLLRNAFRGRQPQGTPKVAAMVNAFIQRLTPSCLGPPP